MSPFTERIFDIALCRVREHLEAQHAQLPTFTVYALAEAEVARIATELAKLVPPE